MAESDVVRTATAVTEEASLSEMKVSLLVDGLIPHTFRQRKKPKNGTANVTFSESGMGFEMEATVCTSSGKETKWHFIVRQLPSAIVSNRSSWNVDKGKIVIILRKAEEISWAAILSRGGLEQAESDEEQDAH